MIVLDSNVISEVMRPQPHPEAAAWLDEQSTQTLYLTAITLAEVRYGIAALPRGKRRDRLADLFETRLLPQFVGRVLVFDDQASASYARLAAAARRRGESIGMADGFIAAIALVHGFGVATRDVEPFAAAGVQVIDPFHHPKPAGS
ncbi:type II toxin-antitoxin system VapC family toxin [Gordonia sp. CPCC 205515]|uniref:type II toxin-antitoxin system VapC family toxin n=1 Tax=Gordonia sp. CPCC 205515 TaxID=3140791 RepID=UPI003AF40128